MNLTKLKLQLQVLINPFLWIRSGFTNKTFDRWLWDKMEEGIHKIEPHYYSEYKILPPSKHTVDYAGKEIWVSNAPVYDASLWLNGFGDNPLASRATALRFRKMYRKYAEERLNQKVKEELNENK